MAYTCPRCKDVDLSYNNGRCMRCGQPRERDDANIKEIVEPKKRLNIRQFIKDNPTLNSTELAQKLAGGYTNDAASEYHKILSKINDIKAGRV